MKHRLIVMSLLTFVFIPAFSDDATYLFSPKGIAEVHITLDGNKTIDDIKRDERLGENEFFEAEKLSATMVIRNSPASNYIQEELYNGKIRIKGRGNTTWGVPKKPYSIDLVDGEGEDNPFALLGMPAHEEWALLAFWHDRSLMRIPLAFHLGQRMSGLSYTPRLRYVELYLNNEYRGLYCFAEKIGRDKNRVDVKKLTDSSEDQTEPRISGGYVLERVPDDKMKDRLEMETQIETGNRRIKLAFKYPKPKNITTAQRMWIRDYLTEFENALYGNDFKDPNKGYQQYIDEDSFIDWYILHELSKGVDNLFHASIFLHKDRDGKLNMSAPWDFDISFGNVNHEDCYYEDGLWVEKTHYFNRLLQDARFSRKLIDRYDALRPLLDDIPRIIGTNLQQLREAGCIEREQTRWPQILREYRDKEGRDTPSSVRGHAIWLKDWLESRKTWLYMNLPGLTEDEKCERIQQSRPVIRIMNPEDFENNLPSDVKIMRGYTYVWDGQNTQNDEKKRIDSPGEHWVQIRNGQSCLSMPSKPVSMGEADDFGLSGSSELPTLASDEPTVQLRWKDEMLFVDCHASASALLFVSIYDVSGSKVCQASHTVEAGQSQWSIPWSQPAEGVYIVQSRIGVQTFSGKLVVKKHR